MVVPTALVLAKLLSGFLGQEDNSMLQLHLAPAAASHQEHR